MSHVLTTAAIGFAIALIAGWLWRRWRTAQEKAKCQLALLQFEELLGELQQEFLAAAQATGKPRGLRWKQCELGEEKLFARDISSRELVGFVGATISFEAIEGGDMEEVEAVGNLRYATAVFVYQQDRWTTEGRVVFNLEPAQAIERFEGRLVPVNSSFGDSS